MMVHHRVTWRAALLLPASVIVCIGMNVRNQKFDKMASRTILCVGCLRRDKAAQQYGQRHHQAKERASHENATSSLTEIRQERSQERSPFIFASKSGGMDITRNALTFDRPVLPIGNRPEIAPSGTSSKRNN